MSAVETLRGPDQSASRSTSAPVRCAIAFLALPFQEGRDHATRARGKPGGCAGSGQRGGGVPRAETRRARPPVEEPARRREAARTAQAAVQEDARLTQEALDQDDVATDVAEGE